MPVYLFTYHAYRSWMPDRARGFVQKGREIQPRNDALAEAYRRAASDEPFEFDASTQMRLITKAMDVCADEGWRLHGASTEPTHLHVLVSWLDEGVGFAKVRGRIKNMLSLDLSRRAGVTGRPWFAGDASRRRVRDEGHFRYLMAEYLPKHGGVQWYEGVGWRNLAAGLEPPACAGG
jgi:hypothetical protein